MKLLLQIIILLTALPCFAQPTGHQRIFLEIVDQGDTIHFKSNFRKGELGSNSNLRYNNYQLIDLSKDKTGFEFYNKEEFIHKTLMTDDHHIQIIRNGIDIMQIEILNAFSVYFLSIPFQKGNFRMVVNDGKENQWYVNTLPYKLMNTNSNVYNITPKDWSVFEVTSDKTEQDYFVSMQFEKQQLLALPIIPEDDPNFRNPRRIYTLRIETADYNFDGQKDYREHKMNDSTKWNYFTYKDSDIGFVLDTVLSSLDVCYFDFEKKTFIGSKTIRIDSLSTQMDNFEYIEGKITLVRQMQCVQAYHFSEKIDCFIRVLENGKWLDKEPILGAE